VTNNFKEEDPNDMVDDFKSNRVKVGQFTIDIDLIKKEDLIKMRLLLPKIEYKLLKNRKSARLHRLRKKAH